MDFECKPFICVHGDYHRSCHAVPSRPTYPLKQNYPAHTFLQSQSYIPLKVPLEVSLRVHLQAVHCFGHALLWARYDKYEWKKDKEGTLYITPSPDAKMSLYNPPNDSEQMVLKAVNLGLHHLSFGIFTEKSFHQRGKYEHRKISFLLLSL